MGLLAVVEDIAADQGLDSEDYNVQVAVLDSDPQQTSDLAFALACIGPVQAGYVVPYGDMPANISRYTLAIWDDIAGEFVGNIVSGAATITDDGLAVYISNRSTLSSAISMLRRAASGALPRGQVFYVGLNSTRGAILGAEFDPDGLEDALAYLGCF